MIRAPSGLGLRTAGVELLGDALVDHGVVDVLSARVGPTVAPPAASGVRDPESGVLNGPEIAAFSLDLADAVQDVLASGSIPMVLGGDCSVLLGPALALRRRGRAGLLFVDGHADFYQPSAEPAGEAASMDLALVTGHGPAAVCNLEGLSPLVRAGDVALLGFRDGEEQAVYGSQPLADDMLALDLPEFRAAGAPAAADRALAHLTRPGGPESIWLHLDADVLDDAVMPAVDYRQPGGLTIEELVTVLARAKATGRIAGVDVTIYNPRLDPGRAAAAALVEALARGLGAAGPPDFGDR